MDNDILKDIKDNIIHLIDNYNSLPNKIQKIFT